MAHNFTIQPALVYKAAAATTTTNLYEDVSVMSLVTSSQHFPKVIVRPIFFSSRRTALSLRQNTMGSTIQLRMVKMNSVVITGR